MSTVLSIVTGYRREWNGCGLTKAELRSMQRFDQLEIAWAEDRATQGCDLSADPSADRAGTVLTSSSPGPAQKAINPRGGLEAAPRSGTKGNPPFEKTLTNGGESWSAADAPSASVGNARYFGQ